MQLYGRLFLEAKLMIDLTVESKKVTKYFSAWVPTTYYASWYSVYSGRVLAKIS